MSCLRTLRLLQRPTSRHTFTISSAKYATHHPIKFMESEDRWKEKDNVSKQWELIYKAPMDKWLKVLSVYLGVSTVSIACGGLYYAIFEFSLEKMNDPVVLGEDVVIANSGIECLVYIGSFVAFHVALKTVLSKYVIRLYQNGDRYIAIFRGHIMMNSITKHEFRLKDFKKLKPTFIRTWTDARFSLGSKQAILLENHFKTPEYFNYLLYKKSKDDPNKDDD